LKGEREEKIARKIERIELADMGRSSAAPVHLVAIEGCLGSELCEGSRARWSVPLQKPVYLHRDRLSESVGAFDFERLRKG
jgi:hypothetical protein